MEKLKKIFLSSLFILLIFNFSIPKVKAEELTNIYTLSNQMPVINDIGILFF